MSRKKGFSIFEILISLIILGVFIGISIGFYRGYIEKAKSAEALVNVGQIRQAEEAHKLEKGGYVGAENTEQINTLLGLGILPKYYEYRVVGVTEDDFIVLAQRISDELETGQLTPEPVVIAMNKSGARQSDYKQYVKQGSGAGTGSGGGGGTTSCTGGITSGDEGGGGAAQGNITYMAGSTAPVIYAAAIQDALDKLKGITATLTLGDTGEYYYNLIKDRNISVEYIALNSNTLGMWVPAENAIKINTSLQSEPDWPAEAIAVIIAHEATHADYDFNPDKWIGRITERWGYTEEQLVEKNDNGDTEYYGFFNPVTGLWEINPHLYYSITEEYFCNVNEAEVWQSLKGGYTNDFCDGKLARLGQGESAIREWLRSISGYADLPEFFPDE